MIVLTCKGNEIKIDMSEEEWEKLTEDEKITEIGKALIGHSKSLGDQNDERREY